jgi:hypothetical protein
MWKMLDRRLAGRRWATGPTVRISVTAITVATLVLLLAGCVGAPSLVGGGGSPTAGAPSTFTQDVLAFARCVRAHGVPGFPDPNADGSFPKDLIPHGVDAQLTTASRICGHLLPASGSGHEVTAAQQHYYIEAAACMRSHGIGDFPDPVFADGEVSFPVPPSISTTSSQYTAARATCAKLIPAGLPDSGRAG